MTTLVPAMVAHGAVMAGIHRVCFKDPWGVGSMETTLMMPGSQAAIALDNAEQPVGMIVWQVVLDEAEILTLAVLPPARRLGLGRRLLDHAAAEARAAGARKLFLEVAVGNEAALALYHSAGFIQVGVRRGYYKGTDALAMRRDLL